MQEGCQDRQCARFADGDDRVTTVGKLREAGNLQPDPFELLWSPVLHSGTSEG